MDKHKGRMAAMAMAGIAALTGCNQTGHEQKKAEPNILLIMADDVAPEHFSCYGGKIPTPNIDKLASEGMIFQNAYAASAACTPSRYGIITGQYASRCPAPSFTDSVPAGEPVKLAWNTPIDENNYTLEEMLNTKGYYTGFVGKFHIGILAFDKHKYNPEIPDFDFNMDPYTQKADSMLKKYQSILVRRVKELTGSDFAAAIQWENPDEMPIKALRHHNLEWMTSGAARFFKARDKSKPFFLHFNTSALHGPNHFSSLKADAHITPEGRVANPYEYQPDRKTIFDRLIKLGIDTSNHVPDYIRHYDAGIIYLDDQVGALMKMLDDQGIADNTIVILTADHSIEPGKTTCYQRGVHVPFIVRWPKGLKAGTMTEEPVQFVDFMPTFADAAGATLPGNITFDGKSFLPVLKGEKIPDRKYLYFEDGYTRGVSDGKFKYIAMRFPDRIVEKLKDHKQVTITHFGDPFQAHGYIAAEYQPGYFDADQLYDLQNDPWEQVNLAYDPAYSAKLQEMKDDLSRYTTRLPFPFDLRDVSYMNLKSYKEAVQKTKELGTSMIPWWNRTIPYPPEVDYYHASNE